MVKKYIMDKGDYVGMKEELKEVDWMSCMSDELGVEESWLVFERCVNGLKEKYIPCKQFRESGVPGRAGDKFRYEEFCQGGSRTRTT